MVPCSHRATQSWGLERTQRGHWWVSPVWGFVLLNICSTHNPYSSTKWSLTPSTTASPESVGDTLLYGSSELAAEKVLVLPTLRAASAWRPAAWDRIQLPRPHSTCRDNRPSVISTLQVMNDPHMQTAPSPLSVSLHHCSTSRGQLNSVNKPANGHFNLCVSCTDVIAWF